MVKDTNILLLIYRLEVRGQKTETGRRITFDLLGKSEGFLSLNLTFCRFLKFGLLDICVFTAYITTIISKIQG